VLLAGCAPALRSAVPPAALPATDDPALTVTAEAAWYAARGPTPEALARALTRATPYRDPEGAPFHAGTDWTLRWGWATEARAAGCQIVSPRVHVDLTLTLPLWRPPPEPDPDLAAAWQRYTAALWEHELGHVDRAVGAADALLHQLRALPAGPDCLAAERAARALAADAVELLREEQRVYDAATGHGSTQGASFPAPPPPTLQ
jgi:predicted secreted Zn-dependent protease